jgi:hypothetical protein
MSAEEKKKMALAKKQGVAFTEALDLMKKETENRETKADDYIITVLAEKAEGYYVTALDGTLEWRVPQPEDNLHLEVVVRDKNDWRFIPDLSIQCQLFSADEFLIDEKTQPFIWHPLLYHYGVNWAIPGEEADYSTRVMIKEPIFGRHDEERGKRYGKAVEVRLGPLHIIPGQKSHGPE